MINSTFFAYVDLVVFFFSKFNDVLVFVLLAQDFFRFVLKLSELLPLETNVFSRI